MFVYINMVLIMIKLRSQPSYILVATADGGRNLGSVQASLNNNHLFIDIWQPASAASFCTFSSIQGNDALYNQFISEQST